MVPGRFIRTCLLLIITGTLLRSCYKEVLIEQTDSRNVSGRIIEFNRVFAFCDKEDHFLLYHLPSESLGSFSPMVRFGEYQSIEFEGIILIDNEVNTLGEVRVNHPYSLTAHRGHKEEKYQLYFTNLPLLHIHTDSRIKDEPKILAWAELAFTARPNESGGPSLYTTHAGIEIRGRTSALLEKKSYGLELWENVFGADRSEALLGMREGEDWILDAMFVDPLRMRSKLSFELWEKMWESKNNIPYYTTNPGIHCEFIELFINQRYMGLYCLSERLDESLIHLDSDQDGEGIALYKAIDWKGGATAFKTYNSEPPDSRIWEGWEQIYPDYKNYWDPLAELRKSVVLDPDEVFEERIGSLLNLESAAEYYLFTNLILAYDNIIKNYFLARYADDSSLLLLPWDLEGSWGIMWDGDHSLSHGMLENGLYKRLMELDVEGFNDKLENSWRQYRTSLFIMDSLTVPFEVNAEILKRSGAIERENNRWPGNELVLDQELEYFKQWTEKRLAYLDQVFD